MFICRESLPRRHFPFFLARGEIILSCRKTTENPLYYTYLPIVVLLAKSFDMLK